MLSAREAWFDGQLDLDPETLIFVDETGASTKMARRHGRAPRGERLRMEGRDFGSGVRAVQAAVARLHLPRSIRVDYGGLYAQQQQSFADLTAVFVAALLLTALLVTLLYERFVWTLAAIATVLLSAAAVLCGLYLTGIELKISALMGLTMVIGIVGELVIFFWPSCQPTPSPTRPRCGRPERSGYARS